AARSNSIISCSDGFFTPYI
ncbi:hypothetical protein D030_4200B, partial [Vibrio parahaemolyticus AQ3810]